MKKIALIKTGCTIEKIKQKFGDFEDWFAEGMGVSDLLQIDVFRQQALPDPESLAGVVIDALARTKDPGRPPITGSLAHDLRAYLTHLCKRLSNPESNRLMTALLDEAARDHALSIALYESVSAPSRRSISKMFQRAIDAR